MAKEPSPLWSEQDLKSFGKQERVMFAVLMAVIILLTLGVTQ